MDTWTVRNRERREKLLQALPTCGWDILKAGLAAGYTNSYVKSRLKRTIQNDTAFCRRILAKREEITASGLSEIETVQRKLDDIINDKGTTVANRIRCLDIKCKILGVYSEKRVIEDVTRQRELDQAEQAEAHFLATIRLRLPAAGAMVTLPNIIEAVTSRADNRLCASHTQPDMQPRSSETREKQGDSNGIVTPGRTPPGRGFAPSQSRRAVPLLSPEKI